MLNVLNFSLSNFWGISYTFDLEYLILEVIICYIVVLVFFERNLYMVTMYIASIFFLVGVNICLFQAETMTAFFWMGELTIIFVFLICIISIPSSPVIKKNFSRGTALLTSSYMTSIYLLTVLCSHEYDDSKQKVGDYRDSGINFYETITNFFKTDLNGIFLSFYINHSLEFCFLMLLILICSILVVQFQTLGKYIENYLNLNINKYLDFLLTYSSKFLKSQNLTKQNLKKTSYKFFNKN